MSRLKYGRNDDVIDDDEDKKTSGSGIGVVVAPGEPLPPGFEGEVQENSTLIQVGTQIISQWVSFKYNSVSPVSSTILSS